MSADTSASRFVTTPIFYVNDVPHVGHAYTSIAADAVARFSRLDQRPTRFATGTDEHGEKVQQSAEKRGIAPQQFCDEVSESFQKLKGAFGLSNDVFVRTTAAEHKQAVQEMWKRLLAKGLIYKGTYEGWYSVRDEAFYTESELIEVDGEKRAPSGSVVEWRAKEPSYFFKLSEFTQPLLDYYEANPDFLQPASRRNEVLSFVKEGLKDLSVSRTSFSWGVPVPDDDEHVVYVWIDALTNYLTVLGWPQSEQEEGGLYSTFWQNAVHIVGKDILRFHAVYWPAMLMGVGIPPPKKIFAHGWWTKDGEKISKSLGNVINPFELIDTYGVDATRYFLLSATSFGSDADFSHQQMLVTCNGFLANCFGNLLNRAVTLSFKNCDKKAPGVPAPEALADADKALLAAAQDLPDKLRGSYDALKLHEACSVVEEILRQGNSYVDEQAPWTLRKTDPERFRTVIWTLLEVLRCCAIGIHPVMPEAAAKVLRQLGVAEDAVKAPTVAMIKEERCRIDGNDLPKPQPVFPRLDEEAILQSQAVVAE